MNKGWVNALINNEISKNLFQPDQTEMNSHVQYVLNINRKIMITVPQKVQGKLTFMIQYYRFTQQFDRSFICSALQYSSEIDIYEYLQVWL